MSMRSYAQIFNIGKIRFLAYVIQYYWNQTKIWFATIFVWNRSERVAMEGFMYYTRTSSTFHLQADNAGQAPHIPIKLHLSYPLVVSLPMIWRNIWEHGWCMSFGYRSRSVFERYENSKLLTISEIVAMRDKLSGIFFHLSDIIS